VGSFIRIGPGIEEGEPSVYGGAPRAVIPGGILKCPDPACTNFSTHPKTYHITHCVVLVPSSGTNPRVLVVKYLSYFRVCWFLLISNSGSTPGTKLLVLVLI
jgi:hypothetical protein